jgi:hypothetical protein
MIIKSGELWRCQFGAVMVHDLYDGLPAFMREADLVFVDPPYNLGLENNFRGRVPGKARSTSFAGFLDVLFDHIAGIAPTVCFVEIGKQQVDTVGERLSRLYPSVVTYPAVYYRRNPCFVLRAAAQPGAIDYSGMDEQDIIAKLCKEETYDVVADLCMGKGATGRSALAAGRQFRGIELNPERLVVLMDHLAAKGADWRMAA